ncbi:hypothetical protein ACFSL6_00095 [Paenibacillus thailandensis]|uniref:hypothetical protein n=1 Tax=Paenibacillus thailandensis TaxID=393250 RepID=UPI003644C4ED
MARSSISPFHGLKLRERPALPAGGAGRRAAVPCGRLASWRKGSAALRLHVTVRDPKRGLPRRSTSWRPRLQSANTAQQRQVQIHRRKLKEIVSQTAVILGEHARRAKFEPIGLEVAFGPDGELPSLVVPMPNGDTMELSAGSTVWTEAETEEGLLLRVLDYKSSPTQLRLEEVASAVPSRC